MEIGLVFFFDQETVLWLLLSSVATKQSGSHGFGTIGFWSRHMYSLKQEKVARTHGVYVLFSMNMGE